MKLSNSIYVLGLAGLLSTLLMASTVYAQAKMQGPWLWMIAPTAPGMGGAASIDTDHLLAASGGFVSEWRIATMGAHEDDQVGNQVWAFGRLAPTGANNVTAIVTASGFGAGSFDDTAAYALLRLRSAQARSGVTLRVGSDDAVKVWLNGAVVHTNAINRTATDFQDTVTVNLRQGENLLLVKVSNRTGSWSLFVGLGAPVAVVAGDPIALPPPAVLTCQEAKLQAARTRAMCLTTERKDRLRGQVSDPVGCEEDFDEAIAAADAQAAQSGAACRYLDNSDGTISDLNTLLMWERKMGGAGCLHCVDDVYTWFIAMSEWLSEINGFGRNSAGFAGYRDWRLPNLNELSSLLSQPFRCNINPCVDSLFHNGVDSFTNAESIVIFHWSTTRRNPLGSPERVDPFIVRFSDGSITNAGSGNALHSVRAVRGGR